MNPIIGLIFILPLILSFIGARLLYKKLLRIGNDSAKIWSILTFGVSFIVTFYVTFVIVAIASGIQC